MGLGGVVVASAGTFHFWDRSRGSPKQIAGNLNAIDSRTLFDICIIGSGPAGAVLGQELIEHGFRTVILESGEDLSGDSFDARIRELEVYRNSGELQYPVASTRVRGLGGTSNVWTGRCVRLHPLDFDKNTYTPRGAAWPVTYAELEPYYERAEKTLRVRGGAPSKYYPPRRTALLASDVDISGLQSMMREVGVEVEDSATSTVSSRGQLLSLIGVGKQREGPLRVARDVLPDFSASTQAILVTGVTVTKLVPDQRARIVGAEVHNLDGDVRIVRARVYVVACGAIESARLLLLSTSKEFPNGIGNGHDLVGRFFMEHPNINFSGKLRRRLNTRMPSYELARSYQFYKEFKREGLGSVLFVFSHRMRQAELRIGATVEMRPSDSNRVTLASDARDYFRNPAANLSLSFTEHDRRTLDRARSLIRKIYADLGAEEIQEAKISWSHHHMGTCRMGDDPTTSIVDRNLRVHDSPNLYVAGSAAFVTSGASQPTLTLTALSHRLGDHLIARLEKNDFRTTELRELKIGRRLLVA
jgi:choline dehydrogenase-like flavoprotein